MTEERLKELDRLKHIDALFMVQAEDFRNVGVTPLRHGELKDLTDQVRVMRILCGYFYDTMFDSAVAKELFEASKGNYERRLLL